MSTRVVLDSAAFDRLDTRTGRTIHAYLREAAERKHVICCAAVTLAEVCRGLARTRHVESALKRKLGSQRVTVVPTEERLAKLVGAILHDSDSDSTRLADAHVVAVAAGAENALVITSDSDDIMSLATAVPGTRVTTRAP